ncbi:MAG: Smr/MutS family protein [Candidatus Moraniibacteriota bacterium]
MAQISLDLHLIYNKSRNIDDALWGVIREAREKNIDEVEIIYGKGSGQLKKRVLKFLDRQEVKRTYRRIKKDPNNSGRVFVYFY